MKIAYVVDDSLDSTDGVQQYVITLSEWMKKRGHQVHYITSSTRRSDIGIVHSIGRAVPVKFNKNKMKIPLPSSPRKIASLLRNEDYDILHVQVPYSPMLAARVIDLAPVKTAIFGTFHIAPFSLFQSAATSFLGLYLKKTNNRFDKVYSVSEVAKNLAEKTFSLNTEIMPNVINVEGIKRQKLTSNRHTIVFLGRLVPRKGCLQLLKAFKLFIADPKNNGYKLIVCGDGPQRSKLEGYVKKNHLQQKVEFKGRVSENEKYKILSEARIAVFPSISGESFGIVLLEAMASGSGVVIGGQNPGYSQVLQNNSNFLFNPKKTRQLNSLLYKYKDEFDLKKANYLQEKIVKKFSVDAVGQEIEDDYKEFIAKKSLRIDNKE